MNPFAWHYANTWTKSSKYTDIRSFAYNIVLPLRKFELYSFVVKHDMTVEHTHLNSSCLWIKTHVLNMVTFNVFCPAKSYNSSTQVHVFIHISFFMRKIFMWPIKCQRYALSCWNDIIIFESNRQQKNMSCGSRWHVHFERCFWFLLLCAITVCMQWKGVQCRYMCTERIDHMIILIE